MPPNSKLHQINSETLAADEKMKKSEDLAFQRLYKRLPETEEGRVLYISRHGESMYNLENRIGGNPDLSPRGLKYARALGSYINNFGLPDLKVKKKFQTSTH